MPTYKYIGCNRNKLKIILITLFFSFNIDLSFANDHAHNVITNVKTLKSLLGIHTNLKLIDVRTKQEFLVGHIPGAVNLPVEKSFEGSRIVPLTSIRKILRQLGIHNTDELVIYDKGVMRNSAHVFWMLETYGHITLSVLDGGISEWKKAGYQLSSIVTKYPNSSYVPRMSPEHLTTKLSARLAIENTQSFIIDSRAKDEFEGIKSKARRAGHIPSATNMTAMTNIDMSTEYPKLKSKDQLIKMYSNIEKSKNVITYCNRGKDSALTYLVLRSLGYKVSVYDGGWLEWGDDLQLPIEKTK